MGYRWYRMFQYEKQGGESKGVLQWPFYFGDMQMSGYHSVKSESFHDLMGVVNAIHKDKKVIVIANELIRFSHKPTDFEYKREGGSTESDLATNSPYTPYEDSDYEDSDIHTNHSIPAWKRRHLTWQELQFRHIGR